MRFNFVTELADAIDKCLCAMMLRAGTAAAFSTEELTIDIMIFWYWFLIVLENCLFYGSVHNHKFIQIDGAYRYVVTSEWSIGIDRGS
mmetsp:Transcript_3086/g.5834  ORF Transcript_3086/g.5834 Transcript_3086/m.5834 type:complete len:88 (-) Transcript_3086:48-311(-)